MAKRVKTPRKKRRRPPPRKPSIDFSVTGLIYCTTMMFIGLSAVNTQTNLLFGVFGLMVGILLVSIGISGKVLRRLKVRRVMPDYGIVGRPMTIEYQIENQKRFWPSLAVTLAEIDGIEIFTRQTRAYLLHVANRGTAVIPADMTPAMRGLFKLDHYQLSTSFPFGFIKRALDARHTDSLLVLPAIGTMKQDLMRRFRSAESMGIKVRPTSGGADEFYGVKEYRNGENPRMIYWKRSAGAGPMVVREMTRISPPRLLIMVDTFLNESEDAQADVERTIAIAATLIDGVMAEGLTVGLLMWSERWVRILPSRGKRHRLDLLTALAQAKPNRQTRPADLIEKSREMRLPDTTLVFVSPYDLLVGLGTLARGNVMTISAERAQREKLFRFPSTINFALERA